MASPTIILFGGSFNPPTNAHVHIVRALVAAGLGTVVVVPCGSRPDKATVDDVPAWHRAAMCRKAFGSIPDVELDLSDLEREEFTRHADLIERYRSRGEVVTVVGTDVLAGGRPASEMATKWHRGAELWSTERFLVFMRPGYALAKHGLPPNARMSAVGSMNESSTSARERAQRHESLVGVCPPVVAAHVERYGLYRGESYRTTWLEIDDPLAFVVRHECNPEAPRLIEETGMRITDDVSEANCILAVGGDGTMIRAVRRHWERQLPFIGVNGGTRGYLLNAEPDLVAVRPLRLRSHLLRLIDVVVEDDEGTVVRDIAVNDAWLERTSPQTASFDVTVDGERKLSELAADAVLVATPQGSTAYAKNMGATPMLVDANGWMLVGHGVDRRRNWHTAPLSPSSTVTVEALQRDKRPVRAVFDNRWFERVRSLTARLSRIAAAELCFHPSVDLAAKLSTDLFPSSPS